MVEINKEVQEKSYKCYKCGNIDVYNEFGVMNYTDKDRYKPHWDELAPGEVILCRHCGAEICKNMSRNYLKYEYTNPDKRFDIMLDRAFKGVNDNLEDCVAALNTFTAVAEELNDNLQKLNEVKEEE